MNTRREVVNWFRPSHRVIVIRSVLMYYAIEINSLFLSEYFRVFRGCLPDVFRDSFVDPPGIFFGLSRDVFVVDLSSLFIVRKLSYRV
jgi:hypothetical protein